MKRFDSELFKECFDITIKYNTTKGEIIMCNLVDLSDKIIVHKRFIEVNWKEYSDKESLLKYLEGFIPEYSNESITDEAINTNFKISEWHRTSLEPNILKPIELCLLIRDRRIVRFDLNV